MSVYGELFGGAYPLQDLEITTTNSDEVDGPVQTGIFYCPNKEFYAFDIATVTSSQNREYLDFDIALALMREANLFCAEPLLIGSFEDCLNFNIKFESTIPSRLGLPKLKFSNLAEGVVIKPFKTTYVDTHKGKERAIVKKKIEQFAEKMELQNVNLEKMSALERLVSEAKSLMTINRINNIVSKHGRSLMAKGQRAKLEELLTHDVLESMMESHHKEITKIGKKTVFDSVSAQSKEFINKM